MRLDKHDTHTHTHIFSNGIIGHKGDIAKNVEV